MVQDGKVSLAMLWVPSNGSPQGRRWSNVISNRNGSLAKAHQVLDCKMSLATAMTPCQRITRGS